MSRNLMQRIAVAAVGIPTVVAVIYAGVWPLAVLIAVFGVLGAHELFGLARARGVTALRTWGYVGAGLLPLFTAWAVTTGSDALAPGVFGGTLWFMVLLTLAAHDGVEGNPVARVGVTCLAVLYSGALPAFAVVIRASGGDRVAATALVLFPLVLTWVLDTMAMAGGYRLGGPKLAPILSPKKTWSGALVGGSSSVVLAPLYGLLVLTPLGVEFSVLQLVAIGLAVAVVAQVGDLVESVFKRGAGMKDASNLIPGHGGVLDRLDSLYFVLPVTAGLLAVFGGP